MILGLKKNEVKIAPYDNEWKNEFIRVRSGIVFNILVAHRLMGFRQKFSEKI